MKLFILIMIAASMIGCSSKYRNQYNAGVGPNAKFHFDRIGSTAYRTSVPIKVEVVRKR